MGIGGGILLMAIGAILSFAIKDQWNGVDLVVVGYILMAAGALALILSLIFNQRRSVSTTTVQATPTALPTESTRPVQDSVIEQERRDTV